MKDKKQSASEIVSLFSDDLIAVKAPSKGYFLICWIANAPVLMHKYFFFVGLGWGIFCVAVVHTPYVHGSSPIVPGAIQYLTATLAMCFIIIVHEAGHFVAARLLQVKIRGAVFMPNGGMILTETLYGGFWRQTLIISAGILAQTILFLVAYSVLPKLPFDDLYLEPLYVTLIFGNIFFAFANLLPFYGSDGYHLLRVSAEGFAEALGFEDPEPPALHQTNETENQNKEK